MSRSHLRAVPAGRDEESQDPYETLVPDGRYEVSFERADSFRFLGKRKVWAILMRIIDGEHTGKPLRFFLNAIPKGRSPGRFRIARTYTIATDKRPPGHLWRLSPADFLDGAAFEAQVVTSSKDADGVELPPCGHYSKVRNLVRRTCGAPLCGRGKKP